MSKIKQPKIPIELHIVRKLIRQRDNKTIEGDIRFLEFHPNNGGGKELHTKPQIGYSCIVGPFNYTYKWMTSPITKVISDTEFLTNNSHYEIEE